MTFASADYVVLLLVVVALYWSLPHRGQNLLLVLASFLFYGWVHPWWVVLLLYSAVLDYTVAIEIERMPARKTALVWLSALGNLGLLAAFKYHGFFVEAFGEALGMDPRSVGLALPIGLSFYTFQSLGYSIDVYRGRQPACRDPLTYLVFVSFFPQLVMGPISRARDLLPQVVGERRIAGDAVRSAVTLLLWGGFKKIVVADSLAPFVRSALAQPDASGPVVWTAGLGASVMMFADFSGYTDIARGSARLLGFELPENFRAPYLATSPSEWWSRWHITFYRWMAEYVFTPLVTTPWCRRWLVPPFVRPSPSVHVVRGVLLTMLLSGLWHGAAWHYLAWGLFMGSVQLAFAFGARAMPRAAREWRWRHAVLLPLMWCIIVVSEILFQVPDLSQAVRFLLQSPIRASDAQAALAIATVSVTAAGAAPMVAAWAVRRALGDERPGHPAFVVVESTAWCALALAILVFYAPSEGEFQYFRF